MAPFEEMLGAGSAREATAADAIDGVQPRWVVQPSCVDEMVAAVEIAHQQNLAMVTRGLGQHLELGNPPRRAEVILCTTALDRILNHEPADMTVRVQAGCPLEHLQKVLGEEDQWLPIDPPGMARTTVGGLLATNLAGPLRASQGTARDLVIGLRTVSHDGTLISGGGHVVKNVAGYDLPKMHIGALGTLGIIVEATFKVRPRPTREKALALRCDDGPAASTAALALRDACEPFWLEVLSPGPEEDSWTAVVGSAGSPDEVDAALGHYERVARSLGLPISPVEDATRLRRAIADQTASPQQSILRLATLPTRVGACLESLQGATGLPSSGMRIHANLANGVIYVALARHNDLDGGLPALVTELRPRLEQDGGALVVERAGLEAKTKLADLGGVWGNPGPGLSLMRALKKTFDPNALLAPGRFVGEL